jgi:hypothetical protein
MVFQHRDGLVGYSKGDSSRDVSNLSFRGFVTVIPSSNANGERRECGGGSEQPGSVCRRGAFFRVK